MTRAISERGAGTARSTSYVSVRAGVLDGVSTWAVVGGFCAMVALFWTLSPATFGTWDNLGNILTQAAIPWIFVSGLTLMLVVNEFDLAFPQSASLAGAVTVILAAQQGVDYRLAIIAGLGAACIIGLVSGVVVARFRTSSFITTLAVGAAATGVELALTDNKTIFENIPPAFASMTTHEYLGINIVVFVAAGVSLGMWVLLRRTAFGRHAHGIGSNAQAAHLAGVSVHQIRVVAFLIMAALAGLAGILLMSRSGSYYANATPGYLLSSYAAVFLGAAALRLNRFNIGGSVLGVLWVVVLQNGLTILSQPAWISSLVQGTLLLAAIVLSARTRS